MIHLVSLFPEALNLDGDQGNLLVLKRHFELVGFDVELHSVESASELQKLMSKQHCHFVLIGHGSHAAHASVETQLSQMISLLNQADIPVMAVNSSVERLADSGRWNLFPELHAMTEKVERQSLFSVGELQVSGTSYRALGYRNTDTNLPDFFTQRNWLLTMLHGPVLAKNPTLQLALVREILNFAGTEYPTLLSQEAIDWFEKVTSISQKIWQLEAADETFEG